LLVQDWISSCLFIEVNAVYRERWIMKKFIIALTIIIASFFSSSSYAQKQIPCSVEEVGAVDTYKTRSMALVGSYLYTIHLSDGLKIYDVSSPSAIHVVGKLKLSGDAYGIGVSGSYAYITTTDRMVAMFSKMYVVDISSPSSPTLIGSVDLPPAYSAAYAHDIVAIGSYVYVANGSSGLQIVDVSNPEAPSIAASFSTGGSVYGLAVSGGYAYVAADGKGILIVDISTPTSPTLVGELSISLSLYDIAVQADHAYLAAGDAGIKIVDVANPTAPSLTKTVDTPGYAYGISASGQYAFVADGGAGLQTIDISNPENSFICGSLGLGTISSIVTSNAFAYVATHGDGGEGLKVADISNPAGPLLVEIPPKMHDTRGVAINGNYAYIGDGIYGGFQIAEISNPSAPEVVGHIPTSDEAWGVAVSGQYAYVADVRGGFLVIDTSNPTAPLLKASVETPSYAYDVAVSGSYAYVADAYSGLLIINISNPSAPSIVKIVDTDSYAYAVALSGHYAYVADSEAGIQVVDISNPLTASIVASAATSWSTDIAISGSYAYVADMSNGLKILNIANPLAPTIVGTVAPIEEGMIRSVAVAGNSVFAANNIEGVLDRYSKLLRIDVSEPSLPVITDSIDLPDLAYDLAATSEYVYVADGTGGLRIVNACNPNPSLTAIHLVSPASGSVITSPPTFQWSPTGGLNNAFAVDITLSPDGELYSTWENLHMPIYGTSWTMPRWIWRKIPSGKQVYWHVRGEDLDLDPRTVITSEEEWSFYKQ
jgi:hypothetical protein